MAKRRKSRTKTALPPAYYELSRRPLQVLLFLTPLIVLYELATALAVRGGDARDVTARSILRLVFEYIGVTGIYLPGFIVVVLLLSMHVISRDRWLWMPRLYGVMWIESLALALPILLFAVVFLRGGQPGAAALASAQLGSFSRQLVLMVGAGIYEELLFRLLGIAIIHAFFVDLLALPKHVGELAAIGITALLFAFYHFMPFREGVVADMFTIHIRKTIFFLLAGVYLACIYVYRGFGIVAGAHAVYDVMVVTLAEMRGE